MKTTTDTISVTIEGATHVLEDRQYTGAELRALAGVADSDKLVREDPDGHETPVPPGRHIQPSEGDNFFVSVRHRRG